MYPEFEQVAICCFHRMGKCSSEAFARFLAGKVKSPSKSVAFRDITTTVLVSPHSRGRIGSEDRLGGRLQGLRKGLTLKVETLHPKPQF